MKAFILWVEILRIAAIVDAQGTVYITDLPYYTQLAACAASAVSYVVQGLTSSKCPQAVTALQSCACTKDQNSAAVFASISSSVLYSCSSTASEDVSSASLAFSGYCNQDAAIPTPTPNPNSVTQYITELPAYSNLAACAQSAISDAVQSLTADICPVDPSALQSCACTKNQNSLAASGSINSRVGYYCSTGHTEDITSAQGVFGGYCGLGAGSTVFPSPSYLSGAVSYYITDMAEYSSLALCAQSAVSDVVQSQTGDACPTAPLALVSCVCVKDRNSQTVSSLLARSVSYSCSSTASADVSSALGVLDYYCSAGKGLVTPKSISASIAAATDSSTARRTSARASSTSVSSSDTASPGTKKKSHVPIGAVIGGVVGGIVLLAILFFFFWRYRHNHLPKPTPRGTNIQDSGKPELASNEVKMPVKQEFAVSPGAVAMQGGQQNQNYQGFQQLNGHHTITSNPPPVETQARNPSRTTTNNGPYEMEERHNVYQ